jgi:hypothetical protein
MKGRRVRAPTLCRRRCASVELSTGCNVSGAVFEQVHRFVLRLARDRWVLVRRELISIT